MTKTEIAKRTREAVETRIESAETLYKIGNYADSLSRSYYAMFDLIRGLLEIKVVTATTHKGAITKFHEIFIKTRIIDRRFGAMISRIEKQREDADYKFAREY